MYNKFFKSFLIISLLFITVSCNQKKENSIPKTITVYGTGSAWANSDQVSLVFSVVTSDRTAVQASERNDENTINLKESLISCGVDSKDISIYEPVIEQSPNRFTVTKKVTVLIRNPSIASNAIDESIAYNKASELLEYNLILSDETNIHKEAELNAIKDAQEKAKVLATGCGTQLGSVYGISESNFNNFHNFKEVESKYEKELNKYTVTKTISITYELTE